MTASVKLSEEKVDGVKARTVLWYMTFFGFAINYILRINVNIAIVDMIDLNYKKTDNGTVIASECFVSDVFNSTIDDENSILWLDNDNSKRFSSIERRILNYFGIEYERNGFKWDEHKQATFLGSYYWLHFITQIPGGILASKYGTKAVFGLSNFITCIICFITPILTYLNFNLVIGARVISGLLTGLSWPAMHQLVGIWIPGNERSRFVTAYLGSSVGTALAYVLFGYIIKVSSWEWVFHSCFVVGTIWFILWQFFVFDTPEQHPRIDPSEKVYIHQVLGSSVFREDDDKKRDIPWKELLTARCTWTSTIGQIGGIWGLFTLMTQTPTYFRVIHGWSIEMVGLLSGFPHLLRTLFSFFFSTIGDYLLTNDKLSRDKVRKLATLFHLVFNGVFCFGLAFAGCNNTMAVVFLSFTLALHGAVSSGILAGMIDNSPNYSGLIMGITSTLAIWAGFVSPEVVGYFTFENQTVNAWRNVFGLNAAIMLTCGLIYILFHDGSLQSWNKPKKSYKDVEDQDLRKHVLNKTYEFSRRDSGTY